MALTPAQQQAIKARGNVLVVAGAGTGKTRTLVERCLDCLLHEQPLASLDQILMVTFTEAAATEMRQRIRERLEEEANRDPANPRWSEQLALFETAAIGTLHSFCLQLVREHFYELELDPQLTVMPEEEVQVLKQETLDKLLEAHYAGRGKMAEAVQQLILTQGGGSDTTIRALILRLHNYTQTRPDPARWVEEQRAMFASAEPMRWRIWFEEAIIDWRAQWEPWLTELARENEIAAKCALALKELATAGVRPSSGAGTSVTQMDSEFSRTVPQSGLAAPEDGRTPESDAGRALETIVEAFKNCPHGKKGLWRGPLEEFAADADFLSSLMEPSDGADPITQDWEWIRSQMLTLVALSAEFTNAYGHAKRELGMVDFHDLEQFALRLLWDAKLHGPTQVAREWQERLRFIFVDEYQDINAAQDKIIQAISREGSFSNRFLVGDVKQSIYRFRLAEPRIFQAYVESWAGAQRTEGRGQKSEQQPSSVSSVPATVVPLQDNFRSREGILAFVNSLFGLLMRDEIGGVDYGEDARLKFGDPKPRRVLSLEAGPEPCVELLLRVQGGDSGESEQARTSDEAASEEKAGSTAAALSNLKNAEKEARMVASRLIELKAQNHDIWDEKINGFRPVEWSDMAILLRSPAAKSESYAKEFSRLNVPLLVERRGFYDSLEVTDLLSLLQILDNPLQDLPTLAVLRSPLVGLSINELASIRAEFPKVRFWTALVRWREARGRESASKRESVPAAGAQNALTNSRSHAPTLPRSDLLHGKIATFLDHFARWRRLVRQAPLSRCLEVVIAETHYSDWLLTQPRGEQRRSNVQRLLSLAQQFDTFQRQGLLRFLRFIEAQREAEVEPEVAAASVENSVRLMSIHQSKGLEFPVVVVADLAKPFNLRDLRSEIILDEVYGVCPQIKPPVIAKRYPSLPYWLARRRQKKELLGEELRLLYVAMTRARDLLLLSGSFSTVRSTGSGTLQQQENSISLPLPASLQELVSVRSHADWLELWLSRHGILDENLSKLAEHNLLRWKKYDDADLSLAKPMTTLDSVPTDLEDDPAIWDGLQQRLSWQYPFAPATRQVAKTSVSILRRAAEDRADAEETNALFLRKPEFQISSRPRKGIRMADAAESVFASGAAHHKFMQLVALQRTETLESLKAEAERLQLEHALTAQEVAFLDLDALAAFWQSDLGTRIRSQSAFVHRELPFTARFSPAELSAAEISFSASPNPDQSDLVHSAHLAPHTALAEEFVVVQGVADLVVLRAKEMWLVDFKTDAVRGKQLDERAKSYEIQMKLYARALARIYNRPVSQCWLYFLNARRALPLPAS